MTNKNKHTASPWPRRFWEKTIRADNGCLEWIGRIHKSGYGYVRLDGTMRSAHRISYTLVKGAIPSGLEIDHLCRNRRCVEPSHLEAVTKAENIRRGVYGVLTTHCPAGHPYDEANTYLWRNARHCRACNRARSAASKSRKAVSA